MQNLKLVGVLCPHQEARRLIESLRAIFGRVGVGMRMLEEDGDGGPDRHKGDLFHLAVDPEETHNLIDDPRYAGKLSELKGELQRLLAETGAVPDRMPVDEGVKKELPDTRIR